MPKMYVKVLKITTCAKNNEKGTKIFLKSTKEWENKYVILKEVL